MKPLMEGLELAGIGLIVAGIWLIWWVAGLISLGIALTWIGYANS